MPLILVALAIAASHIGHPGSRGAGSHSGGAQGVTLQPLPCDSSTGCDLQFVADDWTGGAWVSRDSNHWSAALNGTLTKQLSNRLLNRAEIVGWSISNFFLTAGSTAHSFKSATSVSYEVIVSGYTGGSNGFVVGGTEASNLGTIRLGFNSVAFAICDGYNTTAVFPITTNYTTNLVSSNYALITYVADNTQAKAFVYVNGVSAGSTAYTGSPSASPGSSVLSIGEINGGSPFTGGTIVEIVRHQSALSPTLVSSRAAQFNSLRGY